MNLILSQGYPFPSPTGLTSAQEDELACAADAHKLVIADVVLFEQKHTTTIEFATEDAYNVARRITGWDHYGVRILEAPVSLKHGYDDYAAIIAGPLAYCCHQLVDVAPLVLFYVSDRKGDNDLLVRATAVDDVRALWRKHYQLADDAEPSYIGSVPLVNIVGAIEWESIAPANWSRKS